MNIIGYQIINNKRHVIYYTGTKTFITDEAGNTIFTINEEDMQRVGQHWVYKGNFETLETDRYKAELKVFENEIKK